MNILLQEKVPATCPFLHKRRDILVENLKHFWAPDIIMRERV